MAMGQVKDAKGIILNTGDTVKVIEDIQYVEEGFQVKNKIPKDTVFKITGFPADERYIQVKYGNTDWAINTQRVVKV